MVEKGEEQKNARCLEIGASFLYDDYVEEAEAFKQRWGGDDPATLLGVLENGRGDDRLVAIGALAERGEPWVREHLLPQLSHSDQEVQKVSALMLGGLYETMREEQAVLRLIQMLTEGLPREGSGPLFERDMWIWYAANVLGSWQSPGVVPALRQALATVFSLLPSLTNPLLMRWYSEYQMALAYALGRLGAFGTLASLQYPSTYEREGTVITMACAAAGLQKKTGVYLHNFLQDYKSFQGEQAGDHPYKALSNVLEEQFGLTWQEQEHLIDQYRRGWRSQNSIHIFQPNAS